MNGLRLTTCEKCRTTNWTIRVKPNQSISSLDLGKKNNGELSSNSYKKKVEFVADWDLQKIVIHTFSNHSIKLLWYQKYYAMEWVIFNVLAL